MRRAAAVIVTLVAAFQSLRAQELRGTVRDSASTQPIPAAVLMLLDASGTTLGRNITNERGEFRIALSPAITRIRVVRIGFRPRELPVPTAGAASLDILMRSLPTMLEPVRVSANATCPRRSDDARTYALLEQVRAGLLSVVVARDANPAALVLLAFERTMDDRGDRIASQRIRIDSTQRAKTSFTAVHGATDFVQRGFMGDSAQQAIFYAPDADVLLDDGFAAGYCFRIANAGRNRPNEIGLAFSAADRRTGRIDIDGTLWVDTLARALRDIEFRYVGLGREIESMRPGGRIEFSEMPNRTMLIDHWSLRLIATETDTIRVDTRDRIRTWYRTLENGGELARARWKDGSSWRGSLGTVRISARTTDGRPAPGTVVKLRDTHYRGVADGKGDIEISELVPGPYSVSLLDARLAPLALDIPTPLTFVAERDSTVRTSVVARSASDFVIERCVADRKFAPSDSVLLVGRVVGEYGQPVGGISISLAEVVSPTEERRLPDGYTTGDDGVFTVCSKSLHPGMTLSVSARRRGSTLRTQRVRLDENLTVLRVPVAGQR